MSFLVAQHVANLVSSEGVVPRERDIERDRGLPGRYMYVGGVMLVLVVS